MPKVTEHSTFHWIRFFWRIARPCMEIYDFLILNRQNGGSNATEYESTCAKMNLSSIRVSPISWRAKPNGRSPWKNCHPTCRWLSGFKGYHSLMWSVRMLYHTLTRMLPMMMLLFKVAWCRGLHSKSMRIQSTRSSTATSTRTQMLMRIWSLCCDARIAFVIVNLLELWAFGIASF